MARAGAGYIRWAGVFGLITAIGAVVDIGFEIANALSATFDLFVDLSLLGFDAGTKAAILALQNRVF